MARVAASPECASPRSPTLPPPIRSKTARVQRRLPGSDQLDSDARCFERSRAPDGARPENGFLLSMETADAALAPAEWQRSTRTALAQDKITVIHNDINLKRVRFDPAASNEVISYVARKLEPMGGFIGSRAPCANCCTAASMCMQPWAEAMRSSPAKSPMRPTLVLSWPFLDAAASGPQAPSSDTKPVRELVRLVDTRRVPFFDRCAFAAPARRAPCPPGQVHAGPETIAGNSAEHLPRTAKSTSAVGVVRSIGNNSKRKQLAR